MSDYKAIGKAFIDFYYNKFDTGPRDGVAALYVSESMFLSARSAPSNVRIKEPVNGMMNFNSVDSVKGAQEIAEKLRTLTFQSISHSISTMDIQPTYDNCILIVVTGALKVTSKDCFVARQSTRSIFVGGQRSTDAIHRDVSSPFYQ